MKTFDFELPTEEEMDVMNVEQLVYWRDILAPYYADRFNYESTERLKCFKYLWFDRMIDNIGNGIDRWECVASRNRKEDETYAQKNTQFR